MITKNIIETSKYFSIKEIIEITDSYHEYFQELLSLSILNPDNSYLVKKAFNASLFYKGFIMESLLNIRKAIRQSKEVAYFSERLTELNKNLDELYNSPQKDTKSIAHLQDSILSIETDMSRSIGKLRKNEEMVSWEDIQFQLADDEAGLDFLRVNIDDSKDARYIAMVLRSSSEAPIMVPLFKESDITTKFSNTATNSDLFINSLYSQDKSALYAKSSSNNFSLYNLIWKPLAGYLKGISKISYASDGIMQNLALHAIATDDGDILSDHFQFLQVTYLRTITKKKISLQKSKAKKALLMGGIPYGGTLDNYNNSKDKPDEKFAKRGKQLVWNDLPQTAMEVDDISGILTKSKFDLTVLKNSDANKKSLSDQFSINSNDQIIHLATHGYFETEDFLQVKSKVEGNQSNLELTHSGIVLANANNLPDKEGILTAFEISQFNLENTDLVVLSACETGLGQIYENEGVYGLQRAFKIAGADYIIMSLWQVPDQETRMFMNEFYKNYIEKAMPIVEAFNITQKDMRKLYSDPVKWAGFVLLQ
ncbi:MAG: CHAT domain-containing protein [Saprospiraceae bacterium]|nr:CHAT domain-containing protein [Candidatus Vicinibacter affinis]